MQAETPENKLSPGSAKYILAIDLGSGSYKAAIVADTRQVVASATDRTRLFTAH